MMQADTSDSNHSIHLDLGTRDYQTESTLLLARR
jgi:hypothetical protein